MSNVKCSIEMIRVSRFIDGLARVTLLPFGPMLLGNILHGISDPWDMHNFDLKIKISKEDTYFSSISWHNSALLIIYLCGHSFGVIIGQKSQFFQHRFGDLNKRTFYRTVGIVFFLQLYTIGSGINSVNILLWTRFVSGFLVGLLNGVTYLRIARLKKNYSQMHHVSNVNGDFCEEGKLKFIDQFSIFIEAYYGMSKVWLSGVAVSTLSGGLMYNFCEHSNNCRSFTGAFPWTLTSILFVTVVLGTDYFLKSWIRMFTSTFESNYNEGTNDRYFMGTELIATKNLATSAMNSHLFCKTHVDLLPIVEKDWMNPENLPYNRTWIEPNYFPNDGNRVRLESNFSTDENRGRSSSNMSNDIFFDCSSQYGDSEGNLFSFENDDFPLSHIENVENNSNLKSIAKYEDSKCIFDDNSPAFVPAGESPGTPSVSFQRTFMRASSTNWIKTQRWRKEQNVWKIHTMPHPFFSKIKEAYPHVIHGYSKEGYPVMYEKPGQMNLKELFRGDCNISDMVRHYIFFMEFFSNCICTRPEIGEILRRRPEKDSACPWGFSVVMDIKGVSLSNFSGDVLRYLKQAGDVNSSHYPMSMQRAWVVNAPFWIAGAFGTIKAVLPDSVQVDLLSSKNQTDRLREYIDDDQIPPEYGGSSLYALGEHPYEKKLIELVNHINKSRNESCSLNLEDNCKNGMNNSKCTSGKEYDILLKSSVSHENLQSFKNKHSLCVKDVCNDIEVGNVRVRPVISSQNIITELPSTLTASKTIISDVENKGDSPDINISLRKSHGFYEEHVNEFDFLIICIMHSFICTVHSFFETVLSLWLLSPPIIGGIGYTPPRVGQFLFIITIILLFVSRTRKSQIISGISFNSPIRGYRIGSGAGAVLLTLLPLISSFSESLHRKDNILVFISITLVVSAIFIGTVISRSSSEMLHRRTMDSYFNKLALKCESKTLFGCLVNKIVWFLRSGLFTFILGVCGEIFGVCLAVPVLTWSSNHNGSSPSDCALCFYTGALVSLILYLLSFLLYVNDFRELSPTKIHDNYLARNQIVNRFSKIGDFFSVSVNDILSLFDEANLFSPYDIPDILGRKQMMDLKDS